jgi:hypothetical protein
MATAGQPTLYKPEYCGLAHNYCLLGATNEELAAFFEVTRRTVDNWIARHPDFAEAVRTGRVAADARVARCLYDRAVGWQHTVERTVMHCGKARTLKDVVRYPPDVQACIFAADITGAGATFPFPIYSKWADAYKKGDRQRPELSVDRLRRRHQADPGQDRDLRRHRRAAEGRAAREGRPGAVADGDGRDRAGREPRRHQAGRTRARRATLGQDLSRQDQEVGRSAIAKLNPKLKLPTDAITVVRRSDGSGTTFNFTDYLSKVERRLEVQGRLQHRGRMAGRRRRQGQRRRRRQRRQTKNSIGYVEYAYAKQNKLTYAKMINKAGKTVQPTIASVPGRGRQRRLGQGARLLRDPDRPAGRSLLADHRGDLHPDAQGADRQGGVRRKRSSSSNGPSPRAARWPRNSTTSRCRTRSSS